MARKMKLSGTALKGLSKEQKKKMKQTLDIMEKNRNKDDCWLRDTIKKKLEWAIGEKQRGVDAMQRLKNKILQLDGAITVLKELSELKPETKKE